MFIVFDSPKFDFSPYLNTLDFKLASILTRDDYLFADNTAFKGQGCFLDDPTDRDLPNQVQLLNDVTPDHCIQQCRQDGYTYAGLQVSNAASGLEIR